MTDGHRDNSAAERKLKWDEENRLLAADDNGFVINRGINGIIENTNNYIGSGKIIVDGISASQTAIEVNKKKDGDN